LIDKTAREPDLAGNYPKGTGTFFVNERLKAIAEGLSKFGKDEIMENGKEKG